MCSRFCKPSWKRGKWDSTNARTFVYYTCFARWTIGVSPHRARLLALLTWHSCTSLSRFFKATHSLLLPSYHRNIIHFHSTPRKRFRPFVSPFWNILYLCKSNCMPKALSLATAKGAQRFFFSNKNKSQFYINNNKNINPYERLSNAYGYSKQQFGQRVAT